jgi:hypothetical protein
MRELNIYNLNKIILGHGEIGQDVQDNILSSFKN